LSTNCGSVESLKNRYEAHHRVTITAIARRAAALVSTLTGHAPESMASLERCDGGWRVGVEVVEVARIPDAADILAVNDVRLDDHGDLISHQRTRRYPRGQLEREHRR